MKSVNKNLVTLGALVATSLLATSTFAQSVSTDFSRVVTRPIRPIVTRPLDQVKKKPHKFSLEGKEVAQEEEKKQHYLKLAVEYLQKNPREIPNYMDKQTFKVLAKLILAGKKEELKRFDAPKVIYQRGGEKNKLLLQGDITNLADLGHSLADSEDQKKPPCCL